MTEEIPDIFSYAEADESEQEEEENGLPGANLWLPTPKLPMLISLPNSR